MNDRTRNIELAALAAATDANGNVDFTRLEAQRLILQHQSIDGVDADAVVRDIVSSPAFSRADGKEHARPLLDAIRGGLPADQRARFDTAVDNSNHWDGFFERGFERAQEGVSDAWDYAKGKVNWADAQVSDQLAEYRQWAQRATNNPENSYLERAAANMAADGIGKAQENYGALKGASSHALTMVGETVDLAKFGYRFASDTDFRNTIIGAAAVYASEVQRDPSKPVNDISNAARKAWNEWEKGLEQAQQQGKEREYLGSAQGAVGIELLAAVVPISKLGKFAKVAKAVDVDLAEGAELVGVATRKAGSEATEVLADLTRSAVDAKKAGGFGAEGADLMLQGLAGVRRSQGELRTLVSEMKAAGTMDGLLSSGALRPQELGYLARADLDVFKDSVSFDQAVTAYVGKRSLTDLSTREIGDIGEAMLSNDLAKKGYRDLVPIQNTSGHGNDLVGTNPTTGRAEVFEAKASVHGQAKYQTGDPEPLISARLNKAMEAQGHWAPHNMWEEQAAATAERIVKQYRDDATELLDIDTNWARVNITKDANGIIRGTPEIEPWRAPQQVPATPQRAEVANPQASNFVLPASFHSPTHPGKHAFDRASEEVRRMEASNGIASGPNSEKLAGAVAVAVEREHLQLHHLELDKDGKIQAVEIGPYPEFQRRSVAIDSARAIATPLDQSAAEWAQLRSPHYRSQEPPALRNGDQAALLSQLSPEDAKLFSKIRDSIPGHVPDEQIALATLRAKQVGITDESKLQTAALSGDTLWLAGNTPGFRERVNLSEQAPALQDTVQQTQVFNKQQRELQLAQEMEQRQQAQGMAMKV